VAKAIMHGGLDLGCGCPFVASSRVVISSVSKRSFGLLVDDTSASPGRQLSNAIGPEHLT
jgi:hypothetical protein